MNKLVTFSEDYTERLQELLVRLQLWRKYIEKAIIRGHGMLTFTDIVQGIINGKRLFYDNNESFAIIEPIQHPLGLELLIWLAGGDRKALYELEKEIVIIAQNVKAKRITTFGRFGFRNVSRPEGWIDTGQTMFVKEITP